MSGLDDVALASAPRQDRAGRSRLRQMAPVAAAAGCYLVLACLAYWPAAPLDGLHLPGCACGDPEQQAWFLAWTSFAVRHGLNPFFTSYLNVPAGANLGINTSMPLLGAAGMPAMLLAGPISTYNLLIRLALAASGTSMFAVLRRYGGWWPAAFAGGLLFAFSPYMAGQARRHLFLVFLPLVPLLIPLLDDWLVGLRRRPVRSGILVGLVAGLQYLISPEILLTSALFAAVALVFLALRYRAITRQRLAAAGRGLAAAVPVFAVIAGYAIWMLVAGPNRPAGALHPLGDLSRYHGDLLAVIAPTRGELLAPGGLSRAGSRLVAGSSVENGFYLGLPLLALLGYLALRCRRSGIVAASAAVGAVAFVLSLGPRLTAGGRVLFSPMPFAVFTKLPILQDLEAARLSLFVQLAAAIVVGVGLSQVRARGWRSGAASPGAGSASRAGLARPLAVAAAGLAALLPLVPSIPFGSVAARTPSLFTSRAVRVLPAGAVALTYPFDRAPRNQAMLWQAASDMRFRILGGDAFVRGPGGRSTWRPDPPGPPLAAAVLLAGSLPGREPHLSSQQAVTVLRQLCAHDHVAIVLVDPRARGAGAFTRLARAALGAPPRVTGHMEVWLNVQRDLGRRPV